MSSPTPCSKCSCSGIYIGYGGFNNPAITMKCKFCNGKGWIYPDDMITVPRKYVKDEYFNEANS